ncbi:PREDICTED: protein trapped in endoderm-1-like [Branchiostoma belcheri]|uniref:Protein trapped in endoderm-1-like n=1 Tax=Branchiostoma belcheri TaxID=7741 RepID=A0A6P4YY42_BRABE|nr:PREDICTED: protein trapped in endoderm-1-like [Branchiostoma belcheri]
MPLNIDRYINNLARNTVLCQIHAYIPGTLVAIQVTHNTYIIFLKYLIVVHNVKNFPEGKTNLLVIVLLWVLPALFALFTVYCLGNSDHFPQTLQCTILNCRNSKVGVVALVLVLVITTYSQGRIFWYVKKSHNNIKDVMITTAVNINRIHEQKEARLAKTFTISSMALLLVYTPMTVLKAVDKEVKQPYELYFFCWVLIWTAAFLNPAVYLLTNKQFRTACWKLFVKQTQVQAKMTQRQPMEAGVQPMEAGVQPMEAQENLMETRMQEEKGKPMEEKGQPMEEKKQLRQEQGQTSHCQCQAELTSPSHHFSNVSKSLNIPVLSTHVSMHSVSSGVND